MNKIKIPLKRSRFFFFVGIICVGMGVAILIFKNWEGWIWFSAGALLMILECFTGKHQFITFNDTEIVQGKKTVKWEDIKKLDISVNRN